MKLFLLSGAIFGFLSVALGAFAAHGLKSRLPEHLIQVFKTGVEYQFYHALALLLTGLLMKVFQVQALQWTGWFFIAGIVMFSGSLYMLALTGIKWFGPITPLGGVCFLVGWSILFFSLLKVNV